MTPTKPTSALKLCVLVALGACAHGNGAAPSDPAPAVNRITITRGEVITPATTITGKDFELATGKFDPPFRLDATECPYKRLPGELTSKRIVLQWIARGAKRVKVSVPYSATPLYGVLLLSSPEATEDPTTRAYRIEVPQSFVDAATNGKISAIFGLASSQSKVCQSPATWVLWISDEPI